MRLSIGTGVVLIAVGAVLAFAITPPDEVRDYIDVFDLGLILIWTGILVFITQWVLHRPRSPRRRGAAAYDDREDQWYDNDVHRPGYAGETRRLPTVRGDGRRR